MKRKLAFKLFLFLFYRALQSKIITDHYKSARTNLLIHKCNPWCSKSQHCMFIWYGTKSLQVNSWARCTRGFYWQYNVIIFSTLSIIFESIHMCSFQYRRFQEQLKNDIIFKGTTQNFKLIFSIIIKYSSLPYLFNDLSSLGSFA